MYLFIINFITSILALEVDCEGIRGFSFNIAFNLLSIIYKVIPALIDRTRTTDIIYKLIIVLINNNVIPFLVLKIRGLFRSFILNNKEFILLYSSLLIFTYSIFKSTYNGNILLFSVCIILALFIFIYIYINYINLTLKLKYPFGIHVFNILVLSVIIICLYVLIDSILRDFDTLLMDISSLLNPKSPSPDPPSNDPDGNPQGGPNNHPSGGSSSSQAPNSSDKGKGRRSSTPDLPRYESVTLPSKSKSEVLEFLISERQKIIDLRISRYNNSKYVMLGEIDITSTNYRADIHPYREYLLNMFHQDKTA